MASGGALLTLHISSRGEESALPRENRKNRVRMLIKFSDSVDEVREQIAAESI